jgi:hypothetical protein
MITYLCCIDLISPRVTIGALPDNVLLNVFDYCREVEMVHLWLWPRAWHTLVHVCQRWRYIILESPRRLDLYILCADATPVREMLDIWPPLPIRITSHSFGVGNNIIAALEHHDRVCAISLDLTDSPWAILSTGTVLQVPFPALTYLHLQSNGEFPPVLPDTFLTGSAPRLRRLLLRHILFPALPNLLLSCVDLFELYLYRIPEYISPAAMATCLAALTRLGFLSVEFGSSIARVRPDPRLPPPLTRAALPSLTYFRFEGFSEYLEDLVAQIDAPQLQHFNICFYNQLLFDIRQLSRFICRLGVLSSPNYAEVTFSKYRVRTILYQLGGANPPQKLGLEIKFCDLETLDHLSSIAQLCNQSLSLLSGVEQLDVLDSRYFPALQGVMDNTQWLEFVRPFTAVRILRISHSLRRLIVSALQELTGKMATEVLPALDSLYLGGYEQLGPVRQAIRPYITARQVSGHPVAIHHWEV